MMASTVLWPAPDPAPDPARELPAVDARLVAPEGRHEILDGRVVYMPPADEPHGTSHATLAAVVHAHRAEGFALAVDMLTRTSRTDDIAPDVSVFPEARDPATGGRRLEEITFEIASSESLAHAGAKAAKLVGRGVRRVFAIDLERDRVLEWAPALAQWSPLERSARIEDPVLAVPIPADALLDAARATEAVPRALRARRHPEFVAERAEGFEQGRSMGRAEGFEQGRAEAQAQILLQLLRQRFGAAVDAHVEQRVATASRDQIAAWMSRVLSVATISKVFTE